MTGALRNGYESIRATGFTGGADIVTENIISSPIWISPVQLSPNVQKIHFLSMLIYSSTMAIRALESILSHTTWIGQSWFVQNILFNKDFIVHILPRDADFFRNHI